MKSPAILLIFLSLMMIGGAGATVLNSTVLLTTNYGSELHLGNSATTTNSFYYPAPSGNMIVLATIYPQSEGQIINFLFKRPGSSDITGFVQSTSTGYFSGTVRTVINGGSTSTQSYSKVPLVYNVVPPQAFFFVRSDAGYYFVVADNSRFNFAVSGDIFHPVYAPFKLDDAADSFIMISGDPSVNPITSMTINPLNAGGYTVTPYYEEVAKVKEAVKYTDSTQATSSSNGFDISFLKTFISLITSGIQKIIDTLKSLGSLSTWVMAIAAFIFGVKFFAGCIALFTMINIVWSLRRRWKDPVNEMMFAIKEMIDNEIAMVNFFMRFVTWAKDLVKWW
jgi:hypothetical protein